MKYSAKLYLPILKKEIRYTIINNSNYFDIVKFISTNDDEGLNQYFEDLLYNNILDKSILSNLSNLEKFLILLDNRSLTIGDSLQLKTAASAKIELLISSIKNNIINRIKEVELTKILKFENFILNLSTPKSLIIEDIDKIYKEIINKVQIDDEIIIFNSLTDFEKDSIINNIPANLAGDMMDFIKNTQEITSKVSIISENIKYGLENVSLSLFDSTLFMFLKSIFRDDLLNFYELQFQLIHKVNVSYDHFMSMTPNECKIYINLYNVEIKKREEAESRQSSSLPSMPSIPKFR